MKDFIRKYSLTSFYSMTLIISLLLLTLHFIFPTVGKYSVSFTQLGPALAVVFIALVLKDKTCIVDIKNHLYFDRSIAKWLVPAIAIPSICIAVSGFILSYYRIDFIPWDGNAMFYVLNIVAMLIGCAAEEIGWRGYLLPKLQKRHSPLISSIIVGALWGVWHLSFIGGILGFILYIVTIIEMSVLMTFVFNKTNGNLLLMIVWHFFFNLSSHILLWGRFGINLFIVESIIFGILCMALLIMKVKKL